MKRYAVTVRETFSETYYIDAPDDAEAYEVESFVNDRVNDGDIDTTIASDGVVGYDRKVDVCPPRNVSDAERNFKPADFTMED